MTYEQFIYWLQGFSETNGSSRPDQVQWDMIREHLRTVFHKVTNPPAIVRTGLQETLGLPLTTYC